MSETMRDRYAKDNVEFDLPVENICQELCEEIDRLRDDATRLRNALKRIVKVADFTAPEHMLEVAIAALKLEEEGR